ncbi:MAG TPA: hypothetical protein VG649_17340 [Candidatus Angelobacter sp.]|jgi:hypothetical protein|nr:hypothetical protein [Candidatus Angelobacter sp.]
MKIYRWLFWSGLLIYLVAFILPAISAPDSPPLQGYRCALFVTIMQPWNHENQALLHDQPLRYIPMVMTGWINPLFLVTTILILLRKATAVAILRIIVLLLIPFCWVVFHYENVRPREGHFLWVLGMLLVLFSAKLGQGKPKAAD